MKTFYITLSGTINWFNERSVPIKIIYPSGVVILYIPREDGQGRDMWELDEIGTWRIYDPGRGIMSLVEEIP